MADRPTDALTSRVLEQQLQDALTSAYRRGLEDAAEMLEASAQRHRKMRDPGMANHDQAHANAIRQRAAKEAG